MPKRIFIFIIMALFMVFGLYSDDYKEFGDKLDAAFARWVRNELSGERALDLMDSLSDETEVLENRDRQLYWKARVLLLKGQILYYMERKGDSISSLEQSQLLAEQSLSFGDYSDGWRVISDAGSFIMIQKGLGYIIANSSRIGDMAEKALSMDPENARAELIVTQGLLNAPALFGGNKKKGLERMRILSGRSDLSYEDRFFVLMALSEALSGLKKQGEADDVLARIDRLYPGFRAASGS